MQYFSEYRMHSFKKNESKRSQKNWGRWMVEDRLLGLGKDHKELKEKKNEKINRTAIC